MPRFRPGLHRLFDCQRSQIAEPQVGHEASIAVEGVAGEQVELQLGRDPEGAAATAQGLAHRTMGDTPTGRVVRTAAPALIMAIAVFMILTQLGIATVIVVITYTALIGAAALGAALAFGLGGRDAAAQLIDSGYRKAQDNADQVRSDMQVGRERAQRDARQAATTASAWAADGSAEQTTAQARPDYTDAAVTTPVDGIQRPPYSDHATGAHRDR